MFEDISFRKYSLSTAFVSLVFVKRLGLRVRVSSARLAMRVVVPTSQIAAGSMEREEERKEKREIQIPFERSSVFRKFSLIELRVPFFFCLHTACLLGLVFASFIRCDLITSATYNESDL